MRRLLYLAAIALAAAGCDRATEGMSDEPAAVAPAETIEEIRTFSGKDAYELACAGCHEEGLNGAPKTSDPEAWAGRSWLWEAVLFEHAKKGYNEMPAKGGFESMSDGLVEKAAEYMLSQTTKAPPAD